MIDLVPFLLGRERGPKDFPEDRPHENGNYINMCAVCSSYFTGHKRRVCCKECQNKSPEKANEPTPNNE